MINFSDISLTSGSLVKQAAICSRVKKVTKLVKRTTIEMILLIKEKNRLARGTLFAPIQFPMIAQVAS